MKLYQKSQIGKVTHLDEKNKNRIRNTYQKTSEYLKVKYKTKYKCQVYIMIR